jgi:glycosyltransferase involved in cell wall biosynthesis
MRDFRAFFELIKLFKKEKPDIIHLNSSKAGLLGSLAGFFAGIGRRYKPKIIFTAHGWIFKEDVPKKTKYISVFLSRLASRFQDRIICVSYDDFNEAIKRRVAPPRKLSVVHNSIDKIKFLSKKEAGDEISKMIGRGLPEDAFVLVNLGRLYATKGLGYLIEAVNNLGAKHLSKEIVLVIFGDGPEREALKLQVTSYPSNSLGAGKLQDKVFLVGDVAEASKYLTAFDALVLSSVKEGFPYAILEAGLAGIPVISTNVGGVSEIIKDGENGILIESKNPQAIRDAIISIISDSDRAKKLSAKLKKSVAENFSFEEMAERTEWVYKV